MTLSVVGVVFADWTSQVESLVHLLDDGERASAEICIHQQDSRHHVISHGVLRLVIGRELGVSPSSLSLVRSCCIYCGSAHGAPMLDDGALHFSISRTDDRALIALSDTEVGVDIERYRDNILPDATLRQVSAEGEVLPGDGDPRTQLDWWVRKEALVKGTGEGLLAANRYDLAAGPPAGWWIMPLATASPHAAALAVRSQAENAAPPIEWLRPPLTDQHSREKPAGRAI